MVPSNATNNSVGPLVVEVDSHGDDISLINNMQTCQKIKGKMINC